MDGRTPIVDESHVHVHEHASIGGAPSRRRRGEFGGATEVTPVYREHTVGVVVPAYNEEGLVGNVIETMPAFVDRVYVVDDCSTDDTWAEITRYVDRATDGGAVASDGAIERGVEETTAHRAGEVAGEVDRPDPKAPIEHPSRPTIVPIQHAVNRGVGGAIKTGYERALEDGMDVTAVMAGDAQMDPDQLDRLLDPVVEGRAAYAKGNRLAGADHRSEMSTWRLFGNVLLTLLTKIASGYWEMMDPQNGYTAISREALEAVDLEGLYEAYGFANDLLVELNTAGYRIADVPMPAVYGDERSHIEYRTFVPRLSKLLLEGFCSRLGRRYVVREFHPLVLCYGLGVVGWAVTATAMSAAVARRRRTKPGASWVLLTLLYAFLGTTCFVLAMTLDRMENAGTVVSDT